MGAGRTTTAACLASALALAAIAGCGANRPAPAASTPPAPTSAAPTTGAGASTATGGATSATAASARGPAFPSGVPQAARGRTPAGSRAFAAHFVEQLNASWTLPDPDALRPLCLPRFEACGAFLEEAASLQAKGHRYEAAPVTVRSLLSTHPDEGEQAVLMVGTQERRSVLDAKGRVVLTDARKPLRLFLALDWTAKGWQAHSLKLVVS